MENIFQRIRVLPQDCTLRGRIMAVRITNGKVEGERGVCIYAETIEVASFDSIIVQSR